MRRRVLVTALPATLVAIVPLSLPARAAEPAKPERKPDLGDVAEGTYAGSVISDSKGSSRDDVTLTLTRTGPNRVRITSDYPRLPVVEVQLQRALDKIVQARGNTAFVYDWSKKPAQLDVSFDNEVSWSGTKR
jgi:hypothetical protein